jgi:iron uptake system component EfeO
MLLYVLWPRSLNLRTLRLRRPSVAEAAKLTAVLAVPALLIAALVAGCGSGSGSEPAAAPTASTKSDSGHKVVNASITDAGCEPAEITVASGPTTFVIRNDGADQVTEFEVLDGKQILGEAENLAPGLEGKFSLTLKPGTYATYCPGGDSAEYGVLHVTGTGTAVASDAATKAVARRRVLGRPRPAARRYRGT